MALEDGFTIGEWQVLPLEGRIVRDGETVRVRRKAMDVLCVLAANPGQVVERDAMLATVWGRTAVTDEPLTTTIGELRRILGEQRGQRRYIETIPKRGYRLLVPVEALTAPQRMDAELLTAARAGAADVDSSAASEGDAAAGVAPIEARRPRWPARLACLVGLAAVLAFAGWWLAYYEGSVETPRSIAVLPFVVQGDAEQDAYFGDGLALEILTRLTALEGLDVAARNSAFQFRDRRADLDALRTALGVATVLDGSLTRSGSRVRIQVQLVDVNTGFNIWAETYDREFDDVFAVQTEIARAIAARLSIDLVDPGILAAKGQTANAAAYDLYLRAQHASAAARTEPQLRATIDLYQAALERDPAFALARVGATMTRMRLADLGFAPADTVYADSEREIGAMLEVVPDLAEAYWALGWIHLYHTWNWSLAAKALQKALQLQPGSAEIIAASAALNYHLGRLDRAVALARQAASLDRLRASSFYNLAYFSYVQGDLAASAAALEQTLALSPDFHGAYLLQGQLALARGDVASAAASIAQELHPILSLMGRVLVANARGDGVAADAALTELERVHGDDGAYQIASLHAVRGNVDAAFAWLDRSFAVRDPGIAELGVDPLLAPLRADPRYRLRLSQLGLEPN